MTARHLPLSRSPKYQPSTLPTLKACSAVIVTPASPRNPSVPKYLPVIQTLPIKIAVCRRQRRVCRRNTGAAPKYFPVIQTLLAFLRAINTHINRKSYNFGAYVLKFACFPAQFFKNTYAPEKLHNKAYALKLKCVNAHVIAKRNLYV